MELYKQIKVLEVYDEYFVGVKGYKLYKYTFATKKYECIGRVKDCKYSLFARFKLTRRFFRAEVNNLYRLSNGDSLLIAKKAIFKCRKGERDFVPCCKILRGSRPLNLCITPQGKIFFGEYFANMGKEAVNVYCSEDNGDTWRIVYTFPAGNINHIHGIFWDDYAQRVWVATGDREKECIIGYTEDSFQTFNIVYRGGQEYRCCQLFFYPTFIVFATDSQYIRNEIKLLDRTSLEITSLAEIQGTAIKGGQFGSMSYLSTTVEPSEVNLDKKSHLWISEDGKEWREIYSAPKDILPAIFQFGSIEFPLHYTDKRIMFSGRALAKIDGCSGEINDVNAILQNLENRKI